MKTAIYVRLSCEDEEDNQSVSIYNQVEYIKNYLDERHMEYKEIYVDDGYTGLDFERPDFKRLIYDIKHKEIDTVIVKDLSRLGRNYIEMGRIFEDVFLINNIRIVSINDNYDSEKDSDDMMPVRNLLNSLYLKECEKKARLQIKRRCMSKNISILGCYGYKCDNDSLVIDEEAAKNVRRIFDMFISGLSVDKIAVILKKEKVINPGYYRYLRLGKSSSMESVVLSDDYNKYKWSRSTVRQIIRNEEYTGIAVNRLYSRERKQLKREIPYIIEGTQEAIISKEVWGKALERRRKKTVVKKNAYLKFSRLYCFCCNISVTFIAYYGKKTVYKCFKCKSIIENKIIMKIISSDLLDVLSGAKNIVNKLMRAKQLNHRNMKNILFKKNKAEAVLDDLIEKSLINEISINEYESKKTICFEQIRVSNEEMEKNIIDNKLFDYNQFIKMLYSLDESAMFTVVDMLIERIFYKHENGGIKLQIIYKFGI